MNRLLASIRVYPGSRGFVLAPAICAFLPVFSLCVLSSSLDPVFGTSLALLVAFAAGAVTEWIVLLRKKYPGAPRVFSVVFATTVLGAVAFSDLIMVGYPKRFSSTVCIRVKTQPDKSEGRMSGQAAMDSQLVPTECAVIQSDTVLDRVIQELQLSRKWSGERFGGEPLTPSVTKVLLKGAFEVSPLNIPGLIGIEAWGESADEAALLANTLARTYLDYRTRLALSPFPPASAIRVNVVRKAVPAIRPRQPGKQLGLARCVFAGLFLAVVALSGAGFGAFVVAEKRQHLLANLALLAVVLLLALGFSSAFSSTIYSSSARIRLQPTSPQTAARTHDPHFMEAVCESIRSSTVLTNVVMAVAADRSWETSFAGDKQPVATPEKVALLRACLDVRPVPDTSLIEIRAENEDRDKAASLANAVAEACRHLPQTGLGLVTPASGELQVEVLERAEPAMRPMPSSNPLPIVAGKLLVPLLIFAAGTVASWITFVISKKRNMKAEMAY